MDLCDMQAGHLGPHETCCVSIVSCSSTSCLFDGFHFVVETYVGDCGTTKESCHAIACKKCVVNVFVVQMCDVIIYLLFYLKL
jgi:hypothetical protein